MNLDYMQRKALRRIGRGKSISTGMGHDPIIRECFTVNAPDAPTGDELNVVSWCDWESAYRQAVQHPQITPYGQKLLSELEEKENA